MRRSDNNKRRELSSINGWRGKKSYQQCRETWRTSWPKSNTWRIFSFVALKWLLSSICTACASATSRLTALKPIMGERCTFTLYNRLYKIFHCLGFNTIVRVSYLIYIFRLAPLLLPASITIPTHIGATNAEGCLRLFSYCSANPCALYLHPFSCLAFCVCLLWTHRMNEWWIVSKKKKRSGTKRKKNMGKTFTFYFILHVKCNVIKLFCVTLCSAICNNMENAEEERETKREIIENYTGITKMKTCATKRTMNEK